MVGPITSQQLVNNPEPLLNSDKFIDEITQRVRNVARKLNAERPENIQVKICGDDQMMEAGGARAIYTKQTIELTPNIAQSLLKPTDQQSIQPMQFPDDPKEIEKTFHSGLSQAAKLYVLSMFSQKEGANLSQEEAEGLVAHEIGHLQAESTKSGLLKAARIIIGVGLAAILTVGICFAIFTTVSQAFIITSLSTVAFALIMGNGINKFIKQPQEELADSFAAKTIDTAKGLRQWLKRAYLAKLIVKEHQNQERSAQPAAYRYFELLKDKVRNAITIDSHPTEDRRIEFLNKKIQLMA